MKFFTPLKFLRGQVAELKYNEVIDPVHLGIGDRNSSTFLNGAGEWSVPSFPPVITAWGSITGTLSSQLDLQAALNAKQNTLVSGTNIVTINGNSLLSGGNLTIATNPAGSTGEIQFNNGGTFGSDSAFHWDDTNKRLGVGVTPTVTLDVKGSASSGFDVIKFQSQYSAVGYLGTDGTRAWLSSGSGQAEGSVAVESAQVRLRSINTVFLNGSGTEIARFDQTNLHIGPVATPGARLDVRAQGALSTDIAFRVRNSADNTDIFRVHGNGGITVNTPTSYTNSINIENTGSYRIGNSLCLSKSGSFLSIADFGILVGFTNGNLGLNTATFGTSATRTLAVPNGTAPTTSPTNTFQLYSADIVAGNAAPHFRTENGSVIKLYQQSSAGIATVADLVTVLTNLGLLA